MMLGRAAVAATRRGRADVLKAERPAANGGRAHACHDTGSYPAQVLHVKLYLPKVKITVDLSVSRLIFLILPST